MLKSRKGVAKPQPEMPLSLYAANGLLQCAFDSEVVSSFRRMVTDLEYNGGLPQRIAVVSALKGEGVSYTTLALGTTLANDIGRSVCVVELNWLTPGMMALLSPQPEDTAKQKRRQSSSLTPRVVVPQLADHPGIAQVLDGKADLDAVIIPTSQANLSLLPAGNLPFERQPAMARSTQLRNMIDVLTQRFDHLLLDIPALRASSDAMALASLGEACLVVVRHGITSTNTVKLALDDVKHLRMLGVVLNQVKIRMPRWIRGMIPQE